MSMQISATRFLQLHSEVSSVDLVVVVGPVGTVLCPVVAHLSYSFLGDISGSMNTCVLYSMNKTGGI